MEVVFVGIVFLAIFYFMYQKYNRESEKDDLMRQAFENTINKVLDNIEKTNTTFYEMVQEIEVEHFRQLSEHTEKIVKALEPKEPIIPEPQIEKLQSGRIDIEDDKNIIEKEDIKEAGIEDLEPFPITPDIKVQFEGEERIYPISST